MNLTRAAHADEPAVLRFAIDSARMIMAGETFDLPLASGVARLFGADGGVGLTSYELTGPRGPTATLVTSPGVEMSVDQLARAVAYAPSHPAIRRMVTEGTSMPVRTSDLVRMAEFWETPTYAFMHGWVAAARFPTAVALRVTSQRLVFLGLHREHRDVDDQDLALLALLQRVVAPALSCRAAVDDATRRLRAHLVHEDSVQLTLRETEVLSLAARGLTSDVIGHRLGITERTVRKHLAAVYAKTGLPGRAAATAWWASSVPGGVGTDTWRSSPRGGMIGPTA